MSDVPDILIYAIYRLEESDIEAYRSLANRMAEEAKSHDGCLFLDVLQDANDPSIFRLVEGWRDEEVLTTHLQSPGFGAIVAKSKSLKIIETKSDQYSISGKTQTAMPS